MQDAENKINIETEMSSGDKNSKVYEVGYLLVPSIKEEDVAINYGNIKDVVASFGGEVISDEMPKMINLAYTMEKVTSNVRSKYKTAYFGWTKFTMAADQVVELKKKLDLDPNFVRFLIIKTIRENTIAAKRFVRSETYKKAKPASSENEVVAPINKEEIDKEIDALVGV
ncbi:MAG: 30S ribosomal protein S6 [bacterium]